MNYPVNGKLIAAEPQTSACGEHRKALMMLGAPVRRAR
jgi:hypothetical protein